MGWLDLLETALSSSPRVQTGDFTERGAFVHFRAYNLVAQSQLRLFSNKFHEGGQLKNRSTSETQIAEGKFMSCKRFRTCRFAVFMAKIGWHTSQKSFNYENCEK